MLENLKSNLTTKVLGREIIYLDEVDSTNLEATRLYKKGSLRDGLVILAKRQSAGRGRMERSWFSDGCLTMTAVFEFKNECENISAVTLTVGVAIVSALSNLTGKRFLLKYPNDIMYEGKKLGGILCEIKIGESHFVIVGIGLNVFQKDFPDEIISTAVSLKQIGVEQSVASVSSTILNSLETEITLFKEKGFSAIKEKWLKNNCTIGRDVVVESHSGKTEGIAVGIDDDGSLIMDTVNGRQKIMTGDFRLRER